MTMNLPNKLTIFRVILIPFFVLCFYLPVIPFNNIVACVIFCVASITDFLDGYLARRDGLVTNFGKFMDPLADKLLVGAALICLIESGQLPAWAVVIIISREFIISGFRLIASDNGVVIAASYWGKFKTVTQMIMVILMLLNIPGAIFAVITRFVMWVAIILTVVSLVDYVIKNKDVLKDTK